MKRTFSHYYVVSKKEGKKQMVVAHSKDDETGEEYFKFMDKKKAIALMESEKKITPDYQFCVMKEPTSYSEATKWI